MPDEQFQSDPRPVGGWAERQPSAHAPQIGVHAMRAELAPRLKHSEFGIASFVLALGVIFLDAALVVMIVVNTQVNQGARPSEVYFFLVGLMSIGSVALTVLGWILGLIGGLLPNRRTVFAWLGLGITS